MPFPSARCFNLTCSTTRPQRVRGDQGDWPEQQVAHLLGIPCAHQVMIARQSMQVLAERWETRKFVVVYVPYGTDIEARDVVLCSDGTTGTAIVVDNDAGRSSTLKVWLDTRTPS